MRLTHTLTDTVKVPLFFLPHSTHLSFYITPFSIIKPTNKALSLSLSLFHFSVWKKEKRNSKLVSSSNSVMMIIFSVFAMLFFQLSNSATVVVDGVSQWQNPTVQVGDSITFKHKYGYKLYIFQNRRAFNTCNFTQATLLTNPNSNSYTWHPTRLGFFYFSFNNASTKACQNGQKLAITVSLSPPPESFSDTPEQPPAAAPLPSTGGIVSSSPAYPWPFKPRESSNPSPAPIGPILPATSPSATPEKGGGIPFINSNPAVPLPTGEVDSAIIRPSPTSGEHRIQVVGLLTVQRIICFVVFMMLQ